MLRFEVLIPQSYKTPSAKTFQLEAETWLDALKQGYAKTVKGIQSNPIILCDVTKDDRIHVTDVVTSLFFYFRELSSTETTQTPTSTSQPAPLPTTMSPLAPATPTERLRGVVSEATADLLETIFFSLPDLHLQTNREKAFYFMLDLALDKIGADVGSIFLKKNDSVDLFPYAARGPKVSDVMKRRIALGLGPALFSETEGMGLALSNVGRSAAFYRTMSEAIGYLIRSFLCVPIMSDGVSIGALELINKKNTDAFFEQDLNAASYIADQLGEYFLRHGK